MLLSAIVPAYNRAPLIGETLRSLLAQTLPADEIIVVDDGSTDGTADVAAAFGPPVRVIHRQNGGPAAARNTGLQASRGEFLHFFDSDDLAAFNKQEAQVRALQQSGADIAVGPWVQGVFVNQFFNATNQVLQQRGLPREANLVQPLMSRWSIVPHSAMFRRKIVEAGGGFDEGLFGTEDQLMFLNCLLAGGRAVHTPETINFYRMGVAGKVTENVMWGMRRLREWARFLIKAREACMAKGIEPLKWFGYRRRLWEAEEDLRRGKSEDQELFKTLAALRAGSGPDFVFRWHRKLERWKEGLQQRLTGARANSSFRVGPLTSSQISFLSQLGYSCKTPGGLFLKPQQHLNPRPQPCAG